MQKYFNYSYIIEKNQKKYKEDINIERQLVNILIEKNINISTAESITGGLVGSRIVNIPGASNIYEEGYITYSNRIKNKVLNVNQDILDKFTAVSEETCKEMIVNLKNKTNTNSSIVTTGYAGPGEQEGLAYMGINYENIYFIKKFETNLPRNEFRNRIVDIIFSSLYGIITYI